MHANQYHLKVVPHYVHLEAHSTIDLLNKFYVDYIRFSDKHQLTVLNLLIELKRFLVPKTRYELLKFEVFASGWFF
jgi:hypothetical protein